MCAGIRSASVLTWTAESARPLSWFTLLPCVQQFVFFVSMLLCDGNTHRQGKPETSWSVWAAQELSLMVCHVTRNEM